MAARSLYLHIPFCLKKCSYCDFISYPYPGEAAVEEYLKAMTLELARRQGEITAPLQTLYLGGGTPTVLTTRQLAGLLEFCVSLFPLAEGAEVSVEANPGTLNAEKLAALREGGVNRLSLGVQSFQPELLEAMGRAHGVEDARQAYLLAREARFSNINLDLMFGLPGQSLGHWRKTLDQALDLGADHLSLYCLELEELTPWGRLAASDKLVLPEEEIVLRMYETAREVLAAAGYEHYEISNFTRPGRRCAHNVACWLRQEYVGVGASAASFLGKSRKSNEAVVDRYKSLLDEGQIPTGAEELLSPAQERAEALFLGLRLLQGLNMSDFRERYGVDADLFYQKEIACLEEQDILEIKDGCLRLTSRGLPLGNVAFSAFLP